ncbi:MAG: ATP-dependent protease ATPase subunit HslU [Ignavibacteria bacterium]|nr:ATP-dependent protease ATPase subunit HslU [Ignavibacteria bacterium]
MNLTPRQIVAELDKYVIGQDAAKKAVAIALRNRWRRQNVDADMQREIMPNNIILIGPTGVGKTEIARRLARLAGAPFVKVEATKFTEVGYVGRDVEMMVRDLIETSVGIVRKEHLETVNHTAATIAEDRLVDILCPPPELRMSFDMASMNDSDDYNARRELTRSQLLSGEIEDTMVDIDVREDVMSGLNVFGPIGPDGMDMNFGEMLQNVLPKRTKRKSVTVSEARKILHQQEADKLVDMDKVTQEAIFRAENMGIIFIDEIDKVASRAGGTGSSADVSREGVQRDLLPIVEGSIVNTKYGSVSTNHVLFIASGAFHISKPSDLIPELQGRFPIRVELNSLTQEDFVRILTLPEHALIKQVQALLLADGIAIEFDKEAIDEIAAIAFRVNEEVANIGARRLHTILTTLLEDTLFDAPDHIKKRKVKLTRKNVIDKLKGIVEDKDLSKYML